MRPACGRHRLRTSASPSCHQANHRRHRVSTVKGTLTGSPGPLLNRDARS